MRFRAWLEHAQIRSLDDALSALGLSRGDTLAQAEDAYRERSKIFHPDKLGGSKEAQQRINNAIDFMRKQGDQPQQTGGDWGGAHWEPPYQQQAWRSASGPSRPPPRERPLPPWQTDKRSSYNEVGKDFTNVNFCKKAIYEEAVKHGEYEEYTFDAWDGSFFRGVFSAYANPSSLGFGGMAMEQWNSRGGNPYDTVAVFANKKNGNVLQLVRLRGKDVSDKDIHFQHDSFNQNPSNDNEFVAKMRKEFPSR